MQAFLPLPFERPSSIAPAVSKASSRGAELPLAVLRADGIFFFVKWVIE
jgi:hypothetical protein